MAAPVTPADKTAAAMVEALQLLERMVVGATYCANDRHRRTMHVKAADVDRARVVLRELVNPRA